MSTQDTTKIARPVEFILKADEIPTYYIKRHKFYLFSALSCATCLAPPHLVGMKRSNKEKSTDIILVKGCYCPPQKDD